MAKLTRVVQKIFGSGGATTEFAEIGSLAAGSPTKTKDLATIQSLAQYDGGLYDITNNASEPPRIEDINALYYLITSQLKYLFQNGIPEWSSTEKYYSGVSFVNYSGVLYKAILGDDSTNNNTGQTPAVGSTWWGPVSVGGLISTGDIEARSNYVYFSEKNTTNADLIRFNDGTNTFHLIADGSSPTVNGKDTASVLSVGGLDVGTGALTVTKNFANTILKANTVNTALYLQLQDSAGVELARLEWTTTGVDRTRLSSYNGDLALSSEDTGVVLVEGNLNVKNTITVSTTLFSKIKLDSPDGSGDALAWTSNGASRWAFTNRGTSESDEFVLSRYSSVSGSFVDFPIRISNSTGDVQITNKLTVSGDLTVNDDLNVSKNLELSTADKYLYQSDSASASTGKFIGFVGESITTIGTYSDIFTLLAPYIPNVGDMARLSGGIAYTSTTTLDRMLTCAYMERSSATQILVRGTISAPSAFTSGTLTIDSTNTTDSARITVSI